MFDTRRRTTIHSPCPGCRLPILFHPEEMSLPDDPAFRDVMCASCGTVTAHSRLLAGAWAADDPRLAA